MTPTNALLGLAALVVAWGVVWRGVAKPVWKRLTAIHAIVTREMTPNGGASMKDHATKTAVVTDHVSQQLAQVSATQAATFAVLDRITSHNSEAHAEIWRALSEHGIDRRKETE